jgi:hypothetical protein
MYLADVRMMPLVVSGMHTADRTCELVSDAAVMRFTAGVLYRTAAVQSYTIRWLGSTHTLPAAAHDACNQAMCCSG